MRHLHYVLKIKEGHRIPARRLESPSKLQAQVQSAFYYNVDENGILRGPIG